MLMTGTLRDMLAAVESAERIAIRGLVEGMIETEPSLTERLLGAMEESIGREGLDLRGYRLRIRTLRDRGPNAPEREFGADLVTVFSLNTPECTLSKGFLVQAKLAGKGDVRADDSRRFRDYPIVSVRRSDSAKERPSDLIPQCRRMLRVTPASYVFVYTPRGVVVLSANTVAHLAADGQPHEVYVMFLRDFFREFFKSFIGDFRLSGHGDEKLREVRNDTLANYAMELELATE